MADAFTPYTNPNYNAPAPWANANTPAPWQEPDGATGSNPSFSGMGGGKDSNYNYGGLYATSMISPIAALFGGSQGWFGTGKKRGSPDFYAPSYQGQLFTPQEGLPQTWGTSAEGGMADQSLHSMMGTGTAQPQAQAPAPNYGGAMSGMMPSFIGQSPYGSYSSSPYGGSGYGGSIYQPYVPMGGIGQY